MSGVYNAGETKERPGLYYRFENGGGNDLASARDGVVAVAIKADWGPLSKAVTLGSIAEIFDNYGEESDGSNVAVLSKIFAGGASKVKVARVGTGGTAAAIKLKDTAATAVDVIALTAKYVGNRSMLISIKDSLADPDNKRECIIYSGTREITKVTFAKGTGEVDALVAALNENSAAVVTAVKLIDGNGTLAALNQTAFTTPGVSPTVTSTDYADALAVLEAEKWNVLCVDSNDVVVHAIVKSFIKRVNDAGLLGVAVIGEPITVPFATRKGNAAAFNSASIIYCLTGANDSNGVLYDGFNLAAVIAGQVAALPSNDSPTHKPVPGMTSLAEPLTNTMIEECLRSGCLVLSMSASGQVWIEQGINTLVTPSSTQDVGWKKIRRTKTRFELVTRINESTESIIGSVNNDENGRATFIAIANGVGKSMISEGKLVECLITEDASNPAVGDSAWFVIEVLDHDSLERVYTTYRFRFSDN